MSRRPGRLVHGWLRFLSRISIRLLAFNVLLVFLPVAGLWSLETYEEHLLELRETANVQQGRLLAAMLGGRGAIDSREARRILINLEQRIDARLRIVDAELGLVADSSRLGPRRDAEDTADPGSAAGEGGARDSWTYRLGAALYRASMGLDRRGPQVPAAEYYDASGERLDGPEILQALAGDYGRRTRPAPDGRSRILYSAIPIRDAASEVVGVALVSKSTRAILEALDELRVKTFQVVLVSVVVAAVLSLLVSTTIGRPLGRLRRDALAVVDRRGRLKGRIKAYRRLDEIGDLSRSLNELTRRLDEHIRFIEAFASDVSHEFKNPLASIRNATELLAEVEDPDERARFHAMVVRDIARLEKLLTGVREITRIDAHLEEEEREAVRIDHLLEALVEQLELRWGSAVSWCLELPGRPVTVEAPPGRLAQVFENLLDNARGFSPAGATVTCRLELVDRRAVVTVRDRGPGVPEEHLERIFERFFSYRPDGVEKGDGHTGLGLAIVKAIVEGAGGTVCCRNAADGGALFAVELPVA